MQSQSKRWLFSFGFVLSVLLAGCGGGSGNIATTEPTLSSDASAQSATTVRKFTHMMGEIEVPAEPKQIIGLYMEDFLVSLGIKPAAQTTIGAFTLKYLHENIGDLPKLDTSAMNFEAILEMEPDLILLGLPNYAQNDNYAKYAKIAPTYVFEAEAANDWRNTLRKVGDLVGKRETAEKVLTDYEQKINEGKQKLEKAVGKQTVALVRVRSNKEIRLYGGPQGYAGSVLYQDLGLEPPALVKELAWGDNAGHATISAEVLTKLDVDHLFVVVDDGGKELAEELFSTNIWKSLPAVRSGHVYKVAPDHWMTFGPIAYNRKVEDVLNALVK
ncbi:ABC transporter substrate-binding protein [Brevibacillus sp. AG]|uniref:ABC transporter substrate-binding protein n=1 Tax=Brevibacillus sp. AG TaxID=3020891 RepID=UPI000852EF21|nr:ABC transporter substrate-binding protein [Brevibacillus sp. AG]MDC0759458.1 ABC transporter substrate-binding protein [Brevibacillus sp. AG]